MVAAVQAVAAADAGGPGKGHGKGAGKGLGKGHGKGQGKGFGKGHGLGKGFGKGIGKGVGKAGRVPLHHHHSVQPTECSWAGRPGCWVCGDLTHSGKQHRQWARWQKWGYRATPGGGRQANGWLGKRKREDWDDSPEGQGGKGGRGVTYNLFFR